MKAKTRALDYYRRMLAAQNHAMKRLDEHAKIMLLARSQEVPVNSELTAHWYYVILGAVRRSAIRSDGRRQILDLMLPGDFFFVVVDRNEDLTVEAIAEETALASYSGQRVEQLAQRDAEFARELRNVAFQNLSRIQDQLLIIGGVRAVEKVGSFLLALASRSSNDKGQVVLPLTRYDIAEYLSVSVETVCRCFTNLQQRGAITLSGKRTVRIIDRNVLRRRTNMIPCGSAASNSVPTHRPEL
ncbi:helix-turn-helix domain-containing protein [Bradyrhizobium brasilense]|uniref:helix-turn-helix domain-containing protein n=1 Tax=Bradyrhizobium brasilense TaxID=1419277 RepID=UPI0024B131D0|nr:helix-turn-helix domain-containing protein [Bradyrhizobium australafricanum]WFU34322.1 helix-turn-helix domain-containing protein [Bradyrhizobium australafricanum]